MPFLTSMFYVFVTCLIIFFFPNFTNAQIIWEQTNYDFGVTVTNLAVNADDDVFAVPIGGGFYKTTNNGDNWTLISLTDTTLQDIAINTEGDIFGATLGGGVLRSTDNGDGWSATNNGLNNYYVYTLAIQGNGDILAGTVLGLYRSTNNGDDWVVTGLVNIPVFTLAISPNGDIFTSFGEGVMYRSTDNGNTWTDSFLPQQLGNERTVAINDSGDIFYGGDCVCRSTDNGDNWTIEEFTTGRVYALAINSNGDIFAGTDTNGLYMTSDNGDNWIDIDEGFTTYNVKSLAVDNEGYIYAGAYKYVFRSLQSTTAVDMNKNSKALSFSLSQNYPNPFNPTTKIKYTIPKASTVELQVFDILGREVAELVNEEEPAGNYVVDFNASKFSSGVYFYRIQAGDFVKTNKLVLQK